MRRWPICMLVEKYQKTCICDKRDKLQPSFNTLAIIFSIFRLWIGLFYNDVMLSRCYQKVTIHISNACIHLSQETSERIQLHWERLLGIWEWCWWMPTCTFHIGLRNCALNQYAQLLIATPQIKTLCSRNLWFCVSLWSKSNVLNGHHRIGVQWY